MNSEAAQVIRARAEVVEKQHIPDLKWDNELIRIRTENSGLGEQSSVFLAGQYYRVGWKLYSGKKEIIRNDRGGFRLEAAIERIGDRYVFEAIGPTGEVQKEVIEILPAKKDGSEDPGGLAFNPNARKFFFSAGLGLSSLTTTQTDVQDYSTFAITGKVSANYRILPRVLDFGLSSYVTVAQLTRNQDVSARYFGLNFRLGYLIPAPSAEWFFSIYGGWYYTTMIVSPRVLGYEKLSGPQIYPAIRKSFSNGNVLSAYFKYSPVARSFSLLTLSNREIAGGLAYLILLPDNHSIGITFDISNIKLLLDGLVTQTNSLTIGAQYGF